MELLSWYLARRFLPFNQGEYSIRTMTFIAFISIAVGAFSLALVTAVMNGFQVSIHEKMQNVHPQATIYSYNDPIAFNALRETIIQEFPSVKAISPYALSHIMVQSDYMEDDEQPKVAALKAIDPTGENLVSSLKTKLVKGSFLDSTNSNQIVIGKALAEAIGVDVGETLNLLYLDKPSGKSKKVSVHQKKVVVGGIFATGIDEYDSGTLYTTFDFFNDLFPDQGITQAGLAFKENIQPETVIPSLKKRIGLDVLTWQELYTPLVSALILEKYAMFLILLLITLVASMNIIALLFMIITHKRSDIAILKAMGLRDDIIARSFILLGMFISSIATCFGLLAAAIASWILEQYPFIKLPDVYYVSHLPARMEWQILVTVFLVIMVITLCASWFSAKRIQSINVARVLRFEG